MNHINVTINGRQYRMACEEGQEVRLLKLAESFESRIQNLRGKFGEIGDARLTVMAALTVFDELLDAGERIRNLEEELEDRKSTRLNSSHLGISYAVFCLKKKNNKKQNQSDTTLRN